MPYHEVVRGDCLSRIAAVAGLTWSVLWNLPENADLKRRRKDPNILYPGDQVFVPETEERREEAATGARHTYVTAMEPTFLRLRFLSIGNPRAGVTWAMTFGASVASGVTDADGFVSARIDPLATQGVIRLFPDGGAPENYKLAIGHLDPIDTIPGVQQRLANLAIDPGPLDGKDGPLTQGAVKRFQARETLAIDGVAGPITQSRLRQRHGS